MCDSGTSTHLTPSADHASAYRECILKTEIADGTSHAIEGYGDIMFVFRFGNG